MTREQHLLILLAEECAEVQQLVAKILRFGENTRYANNVEELQKEFNDILAIADMLYADGFEIFREEVLIDRKIEKAEFYINESKELGMIEDDN